ncbi:MAG TPA: YicC/YloC family endoribonuclease [Burkholderiales bacterium]|jgi:uncharacterized protein (TIGR00255 family)|nr:YicC/YloC family endoribonuclease [Burkholderiales bacterium]
MTGFAAAARELPQGVLNLELRAVNHRYLDIQFRLPEELRTLEGGLREQLTARLTRGKVECRAGITPRAATADSALEIDRALLGRLFAAGNEVRALAPQAAALSVADILRWPGVLATSECSLDELRIACRELLQSALDEFTAARAREGEKLKALLLERIARMEQQIAAVAPRMPEAVAQFQEKLALRLRDALGEAHDERIRQEVVLFANKIDVDEELSRLVTHLAEARRILDRGGAVGKRLDFLMQELNREANTLGSKAASIEVTQTAMELKVLIEQMREQIQNIE